MRQEGQRPGSKTEQERGGVRAGAELTMMAGTVGPEELSMLLLVPSCGFRMKESVRIVTNKMWGKTVLGSWV